MTKREIIDIVDRLEPDRQIQWMIDLGAQLTISARASYSGEGQQGNAMHLMGFNEMQHQIYGRIRTLSRGEEWTLDSFLNGLMQRAQHYEIEGDFGWALKMSLRGIVS
jgi:hypothetical protein